MTKQEQVKAIFIEEAGEIIEKLNVDILRFEENSADFELLNEIFRGVHTLKGNSNAFGFTRLGEFVHHFEDLLDHYRTTKEAIEPDNLELFVGSVDVINDVMQCELDTVEELPQSYTLYLEKIIALMLFKTNQNTPATTSAETSPLNDLASEFSFDEERQPKEAIEKRIEEYQSQDNNPLNLFYIDLRLDSDGYKRGFDPLIFLHILQEKASSVESIFDMSSVKSLEEFSADENQIANVLILVLTQQNISDIEECFEFLFEHEYTIRQIEKDSPTANETPEISADTAVAVPAQTESIVSKKIENSIPTATLVKSTIKIDTNKLDELFDSVGELVIAQNFIAQNEKIRAIEDESISRAIETLSKITKRIQDRVMSLRMVAIRDTFDKMKRVVRDTSKKTGKPLHLIVQGEDTEIDKTMIDSLSDPLIHIIRNAIDHGLENDIDERIAANKEPEGTITLRAYHKSGSIVVSVKDDGRGISKEKVFQKAVSKGIIAADDNLTDSQIFSLIMQPGFSTVDVISDLSGRGVGLDVVKTSIEKLRGKIEIDSKLGKGSTFSMVLPLTLAIIDGMLVKAAEEIYIIPTLSVVESFRPNEEIVHVLKGKGEFVSLRGQHIPIVRLSDVFSLSTQRINPWEGILVCVETESGRIAIMVDELLGRQQVVIKTLGQSLAKLKEISGGAILGNGDIALILNVEAFRPALEG
ncbi:MAG: chemotaxis protein CheA [Epsilonproteobacteria bacterium]|nr:chemotaxis protein CheA [Campylobacterota bacterium]